jgi:probable HAF family extracellular repeat protein
MNLRSKLCTPIFAALLFLTQVAVCQTLQYTSFQVPGSIQTTALGLNNLGQIVGSFTNSNYVQSGYLFSDGQFQTIACPGATYTLAQGINDDGVIVGWCGGGSEPEQGFIYRNGQYSYVTYYGASQVVLVGINNQGEIVESCEGCDLGSRYVFVYKAGHLKAIPTPNDRGGAINSNGSIAGSICSTRKCEGATWVQSGETWSLQDIVVYPGATSTSLNGINDNGDLAGGFGLADGQVGGFVYIQSTNSFVGFDIENSSDINAQGINNSGEIVGYYGIGSTLYGFYGYLSQ